MTPHAKTWSANLHVAPMAFTARDLLVGTLATWITFTTLVLVGANLLGIASLVYEPPVYLPLLSTISSIAWIALITAVVAGAAGLLASPVGMLLVWPIAWILRNIRHPEVHAAVYAALGLALAAAYLLIMNPQPSTFSSHASDYLIMIPAPAIAVAVPFGWWIAARLALNRRPPR